MEYHNNILCFEAGWLIDNNIVTSNNYQNLTNRKKIQLVRRASRNTPALIAYDSMPDRIKDAIKEIIGGDPYDQVRYSVLEGLITGNAAASAYFEDFKLNDGRRIPKETRIEYYHNAIILDAIHTLIVSKQAKKRAMGGKTTRSWEMISEAVQSLNGVMYKNTLPPNPRSLERKYLKYKGADDKYLTLIHKNYLKDRSNAAAINDEYKESFLIEFLGDPRNLDNAQIARFYNQVAEPMNWRKITGDAVAYYRDKYDLETYAGRHGSTALHNNKLMQAKRTAPTMPLYYWTLDGWDVELLYQRTENGKTTYHHRPTVVIVLDPCKKYPIGYAIGTHETPELIKAALRNAAQHTRELFGNMYRTHQIQSDRYAFKALTPIYEAMAGKVTPARAKNAKAKVIEPYFKYVNKTYCQLQKNWSGYGVTSAKDKQPNVEYMNKYKVHFPDYDGVVKQVAAIVEMERQAKREAYLNQWAKVDECDKIILSDESYLYHFGIATGHKNMLRGEGVITTIKGVKRAYDCFDPLFRHYASTQWNIIFDPDDTKRILAVNDDASLRFVLEDKYLQPMALKDRSAGDSDELQRIKDYNGNVINYITETRARSGELVRELFDENPQLDGTLAKILLTDSTGQHKNNRNLGRAAQPSKYMPIAEPVTESLFDKY